MLELVAEAGVVGKGKRGRTKNEQDCDTESKTKKIMRVSGRNSSVGG